MTGRGWSATLGLFLLMLVGCGTGAVTPDRETPATSGIATASPVPSPKPVAQDQQFGLDEIAEYPDGLEIEVSGAIATRAEAKDRGAGSTRGEMVAASIRIGNGRELPYEATSVQVFVTYGDGMLAPAVVDETGERQRGFMAAVPPGEEATAPVAFAVPFAALGKVTFTIDPGDDQHEPVSFTGQVQRE